MYKNFTKFNLVLLVLGIVGLQISFAKTFPSKNLMQATNVRYTKSTGSVGSDVTLSNLVVSGANLSTAFDSGITNYNAVVATDVESVTVTPTTTDPDATMLINGIPIASGQTSADIPLDFGDNSIQITINGSDGESTGNYTITVTRAKSSDAALANLLLSGSDLSPDFSFDINDYSTTVASNTLSVSVTPYVDDLNATVTVNKVPVNSGGQSGDIGLIYGDNVIIVSVIAHDGTVNTYTITVTRPKSSDAALANLLLTGPNQSPDLNTSTGVGFDPAINSYNSLVSNSTSLVNLTPTLNDLTATVTINNTKINSGQQSSGIALNYGDNIIKVLVTAQDGTTNTYTITVTRAKSADATLSNLTSTGANISPAFDTETHNYTASVTRDVS